MHAPSTPRELLASCLKTSRFHIGEILLGADYTLRHADDAHATGLSVHRDPRDARELARYDSSGGFRPLKTAPNLKRGWLLEAGCLEGMELALEYFYPSALGLWLSLIKGVLHPTTLRETLDRQTGMYRITQLLTDEQAADLVKRSCNCSDGCLRTILWKITSDVPVSSLPSEKLSLENLPSDRIPLICRELCNLVVAAARPIAKGNLPKKE